MALEYLDLSAPNDGQGTPLRSGGQKINDNFDFVNPRQFGLGSYPPASASVDLDDYDITQFFSAGSVAPNNPANGEAVIGYVAGYSDGRLVQNVTGVTTGSMFVRTKLTTWSAWQPVYNAVNYQPDEVEGLNARLVLQNNSGGTVNVGASVAGASLNTVKWSSAMVPSVGGTYSGTYKNVTGQGVNNTEIGIFVRIA
jgi:hypothetical protein